MERITDFRNLNDSSDNEIMANGKTYKENLDILNSYEAKLKRLNGRSKEYKKTFKELTQFIKSATALNAQKSERFPIAQITKRKCSEKIQPKIKVGDRYFIVNRDTTKDGTSVIILANLKDYSSKKDNVPVMRCNARRFEWKEFSQDDLVEENLIQEVRKETKLFLDNLSMKEQMRIAFVPVIINNLAWEYAFKATACAARDKVSLLKKQSREIKETRQKFIDELKKDLDFKHIRKAQEQTDMCIAEMQRDLTILYFSVNNEFKREVPDYPFDEMRTYAIISLLFIRFLQQWNEEQDKFLALRFKDEDLRKSILPPLTEKLRTLMKAFAGVEKFNFNEQNISTGMKVLQNRIKSIEFSVF